jgi:hypothetical protein
MPSSKNRKHPRGKIRRGFFRARTEVAKMRGSVLFPTTRGVSVTAKPESNLNGWPSWMRDALAIEKVQVEPARTGRACVRKQTRMP